VTTTTIEMLRKVHAAKGGLRAAFFIFLLPFFQVGSAFAHGDDKPKHGGIMGRGDESVSVEFVFEKGIVTVYVEDHETETAVAAEKVKDAWLGVTGSGRPGHEVKLVPGESNRLSAAGLTVRVGDRMTVRLRLPDGRETRSFVVFRESAPRR
jgi:hypothetical protein